MSWSCKEEKKYDFQIEKEVYKNKSFIKKKKKKKKLSFEKKKL